jgi:hypothetical protein
MTAILTHVPKKKGFFLKQLERFAENNFPKRFKRLIYISSIFAIVKQIREPDQILVNKLNSVFKIARYPDAMIFPMYIKSLIWFGLNEQSFIQINDRKIQITELDCECFDNNDCEAIAQYFNKTAPSWIHYGSERLMVHDVVTLMKHLRDFNQEAIA